MTDPDFEHLHVTDAVVREQVAAGRPTDAVQSAHDRIATGLADLSVVQMAAGNLGGAVKNLQDALTLSPGNRPAFHNLVATMLSHGMLAGAGLQSIRSHLIRHRPRYPWMQDYRSILYMPRWLNLEFVLGKCNLKCRMCLGRQSPSYPDRLSYLSADDLGALLAAAPTVGAITLSSGDSDPLLHPQIDRVIDIAQQRSVMLDIFTNGQPLGPRTSRKIVESQAVNMVNFSIDAATAETYATIRGGDLGRVLKKIEMLQEMKREGDRKQPHVSMSFVAMRDNIHELPDFVRTAVRLGAMRVFVEDLIGWEDGANGNHPASDHPEWSAFVREARRLAGEARMLLQLPERMLGETAGVPAAVKEDDGTSACRATGLTCCGWIDAVYVNQNGRLDPCCLIHGVADMGCVHDGPVHENRKYRQVKELLLSGKVFDRCAGQRMCQYVQQQHAAGIPLQFMTRADLGDLHPDAAGALSPGDPDKSRISLEVVPAAS
ncbi:MAG: radical SAM protein [Phycisphaerae bacterium]